VRFEFDGDYVKEGTQLDEGVALHIPGGVFHLGPQIHGTRQRLIEQRNQVRTYFQGNIDPREMEEGVLIALTHDLYLAAICG
jgi:hypothetical protein